MKKIPTVFERDWSGNKSLVTQQVNPLAAWVLAGEGTAYQKLDGTACLVQDGKLYKRYDAKNGKTPPADFIPADEPDAITGHWPGWVPVAPADKWHVEAWGDGGPFDGTYELVGPKIQGNPEGWERHTLVKHDGEELELPDMNRSYAGIKAFLAGYDIEGIVFHHPDGRMAKIKKSDFGLSRKPDHV